MTTFNFFFLLPRHTRNSYCRISQFSNFFILVDHDKYIRVVNMYVQLTWYVRKYSFQTRPKIRPKGEKANTSTQCDHWIFAARDTSRHSNRHFLGRAVCSVGETNNTQDSTPGLSEFGKVSQHLHYTLRCGFTFFRRTEKYCARKKMPACTYTLPKELPFYDRGWNYMRHVGKIIPQTFGQDASRWNNRGRQFSL